VVVDHHELRRRGQPRTQLPAELLALCRRIDLDPLDAAARDLHLFAAEREEARGVTLLANLSATHHALARAAHDGDLAAERLTKALEECGLVVGGGHVGD